MSVEPTLASGEAAAPTRLDLIAALPVLPVITEPRVTQVSSFTPVHEISVLVASAGSEGSGVSAHMRRLTRAFASRMHKVWM